MLLPDLLTINGVQFGTLKAESPQISNVFHKAPLLSVLEFFLSNHGDTHTYDRYITGAVIGSRSIDGFAETSLGAKALITEILKVIEMGQEIDVAAADAFVNRLPDGTEERGAQAYFRYMIPAMLQDALFALEERLLIGSSDFQGIRQLVTTTSEFSGMLIDAGGEDTADIMTEVYAIYTDTARTGFSGLITDGIQYQEVTSGISKDPENAKKKKSVYTMPGAFLFGKQVPNVRCIGRIRNLTAGKISADGEKAPLTESLMDELFECFPASQRPTHFIMNGTAGKQLRDDRRSRNAVNMETGLIADLHGVPIVYTDTIPNTLAAE